MNDTEMLFAQPGLRQVISASRRTDLARCFPAELAGWLAAGSARVRNPFNGRERGVDLRPEQVHTLILWSKDFSRVLNDEYGLRTLLQRYDQVFFHYTVTGLGGSPWEPGVLSPGEAAQQLRPLVELAGDPRRVAWRFDPMLFWREGRAVDGNLSAFDQIADAAGEAGITRVIVSLYQHYAKAKQRAERAGLRILMPRAGRLKALAVWLLNQAKKHGLDVRSCCSPALAAAGLPAGHCVDSGLLTQLHPAGLPAPGGKDSGQRKNCGCSPSADIGDYRLSCPQGCVYCYANPR